MAAKLSYENRDFVQSVVNHHWKMKFVEFYNFRKGINLTIMINKPKVQPILQRHWSLYYKCMDDRFRVSWCEFNKVGKTHRGFMKALGMQQKNRWPLELEQYHRQFAYYTIRKMLEGLLKVDENAKFILTGHSLGGALAVLFAGLLAMHEGEYAWMLERLEGICTFGQPRVGNEKFGEYMTEKFKKYKVRYMRYVYSNDLVPRIPCDDKTLLFKHFGQCFYYNSCYRGKVLNEQPNKNYFSLLWFIPKRLNAVWELIRGFILPLLWGSEYKEGWFMLFWRLIGLVCPGLAAHAPQDYVNITRLGTVLCYKE